MNTKRPLQHGLETLVERELPGGGFAAVKGGPFRPDSTAWAVMALRAGGRELHLNRPALARLAEHQMSDGRVPLLKDIPENFWPTALALMAWAHLPEFKEPSEKAIDFLLSAKGETFPYDGNFKMGHNTELVGWPWVENTYAWVVPTTLAIIALKAHGRQDHARVRAGVALLLNRQLPNGGWNYGDTFTFGTQLLPFPDTTGYALEALGGLCNRSRVEKSIHYLQSRTTKVRSPLSLAWGLIGLGTWSARPTEDQAWINESLALQARYGSYDTDLLGQLLVAAYAHKGLVTLIRSQEG